MSEWAIRQDPTGLERFGKTAKKLLTPERFRNPSVMDPRLGPITGIKDDGDPYGTADAPNPVPILMDMMPMAGITAYHASPAKFNKFSNDFSKKGEGNMAKGWGGYFAENPKVADQYLKKFNKRVPDSAVDSIRRQEGNYRRAIREQAYEANKNPDQKEFKGMVIDEIRNIRSGNKSKKRASYYDVDIPDNLIDKMLDLDLPLSKQSEYIKNVLNERGWSNGYAGGMKKKIKGYTGQNLYDEVTAHNFSKGAGRTQAQEQTSKELLGLGVPGARYLDELSRYEKKGTSNFVMYDVDPVTIVKRDGKKIGERLLGKLKK